ncbi:hypothetical protein J2X14_003134 [Pantoea alhagi]|uniref:hypothetical protein n=1 Tax=Mixta sp. BE291 TaxID=3158787 RepID=UPI002864F0BA|nr:hypothetical protein [Pantoea alhagi]
MAAGDKNNAGSCAENGAEERCDPHRFTVINVRLKALLAHIFTSFLPVCVGGIVMRLS